MPISLASLEANTAVCTVSFGGETALVRYRPNGFNSEWSERGLARAQEVGPLVAQAEMIADVVVSWDVIDLDGEPMPILVPERDDDGKETGDMVPNPRLKLLGGTFLRAVLTQCQQDLQPAEDERKKSGAGSRAKAK